MRNLSNKFELPSNPTYKDFERSDGDSSNWPQHTTRIVDSEGHVNYMAHIPIDAPIAVKWRVQIGEALCNALGWTKGPAYVLRDWPSGYRMFDHNKGPADSPRHDVYLFGSTKTAKFRSVPEFIPHAIWLFKDATAHCECKYCSKKSQREITSSMGESGILPASPYRTPSPSRPVQHRRPPRASGATQRESNLRRPPIYVAVQRPPRLKRPSSHIVQKYPMVAERADDLRAVHLDTTSKKLRRWFRMNEVVWCSLNPPIPGPSGLSDSIRFWPSVVEGAVTHVESLPTPISSPPLAGSSEPHKHSMSDSDKTSHPDYDPETPPWTVNQSTRYKVQLLGTSCTLTVADEHILPYQAHYPPDSLMAALKDVPVSSMNINPEFLSQYRPCAEILPPHLNLPPSPVPTFEASAGPFALAVQIGSQISRFWGLTDDWEFKFTVGMPTRSTPTSLQEAIAAASTSNAAAHLSAIDSASAPRSYGTTEITASRDMSSDETQKLTSRMLGEPSPIGQTLTQKRFQGLWWGAERIWTDDFVRLKLPRGNLARHGAQNIRKPSGAGPAVLARCKENGSSPEEFGASSRGVFMRLDALFVVDVPMGKKDCRASGMLYELADQDWVDDNENVVGRDSGGVTAVNGFGRTSSQAGKEHVNGDAGPSTGLSQPSPLKPAALPNPNPAVSVEETSPQVLSQLLPPKDLSPGQSQPEPDSSVQLSRPLPSVHYKPPQPPIGYKFRPILEEGYEAVLSIAMLSGRYYPGIIHHPLLSDHIQEDIEKSNHLWALEGLSPGINNSVDPTIYNPRRDKTLQDGNSWGRTLLEEYLAKVAASTTASEHDQEDVAMGETDREQMDVDIATRENETRMQVD